MSRARDEDDELWLDDIDPKLLRDLAAVLPDRLVGQAIELGTNDTVFGERPLTQTDVLRALAKRYASLPAATRKDLDRSQPEAIARLAPFLPKKLLLEVLDVVRAFGQQGLRAQVLSQLLPSLPDDQRLRVLAEIYSASRTLEADERAAVLAACLSQIQGK